MKIDNVQRSNLQEMEEFKWNGFYRAKVIDAHDLNKLGRVKVWIPDMMPEETEIDPTKDGLWAHPANGAVGGRNIPDMTGDTKISEDGWHQGQCIIPPNGSWVWLFFEKGDASHPYYFAAGEFGQTKVLPENQLGSAWEKKWTLYKSKEGRSIVISDDPDDARIKITGKKRQITEEPDGDLSSVKEIDGNQTVIWLDERPGSEKIAIKDHRGNHFTIHTDDEVGKDRMDIYMGGEIHMESKTDIFIKSGGNLDMSVGGNFKNSVKGSADLKVTGAYKEKALSMDRFSLTTDKRTAVLEINEMAGLNHNVTSGYQQNGLSGMNIKQTAMFNKLDLWSAMGMHLQSGLSLDLYSLGNISLQGLLTTLQGGASCSALAAFCDIAGLASQALDAIPNPGKLLDLILVSAGKEPITPTYDKIASVVDRVIPILGDPYDSILELPQVIPELIGDLASVLPILTSSGGASSSTTTDNFVPGGGSPGNITAPVINPPPSSPANAPAVVAQYGQPEVRFPGLGVGHMFALSLADEYRDKIIPLVKQCGGTYTGFYVMRDLDPGADNAYFDPGLSGNNIWNDYRNPSSWNDWNTKWWSNLDEFLAQAKLHNVTVIPTIMDFCCSPNDPFLVHNTDFPYRTSTWDDTVQGLFISKFTDHLKASGVDYIINLGAKSFNTDQQFSSDLLPSSGYLRKYITYMVEVCDIDPSKMMLTATPNRNLWAKNPYVKWKSFSGKYAPQSQEINIEEYADDKWGGNGEIAVYDDGVLVDGYLKLIQETHYESILCMNNWKMTHFVPEIPVGSDSDNVMNYIFAPRQREAIRQALGIYNSIFIDFS